MIENGVSAYSILVATDASDEIKYAAKELQTLIKEATGATLPIVKDSDVSKYTDSSKVISLGATSYATAAGVEVPDDLSDYGYVIKTIDKSIFIQAKKDIGVTFGTYGLLERQFNFECFNDDFYTIDQRNYVALEDYDVSFESDMNVVDYGSHYVDGVAMRRMSYTKRADIIAGNISVHNSLKIVPYETYGSKHSEWFLTEWSWSELSNVAVQLCYTANGNAAEYSALVTTVAEQLKTRLITYPEKDFVIFSQMDKNVWCTCSACSALKTKYGTDSASVIMFINDVANKIGDLKDADGNARDYKILYLVYQKTVDAPATYNAATGKYEAIDKNVVPAAHTVPIFAQTAINYHLSIHDTANAEYKERILKWQALTMEHGMGIYTYFTNYLNYWLYYDSYTYMQELYEFYAQGNVQWFYEEGQSGNDMQGGTAWSALRTYLSSNLAKDSSQDLDALTENFFKNYYGEAWEDMLSVFNATRTEFQKHTDSFTNQETSPPFINIDSKAFWSYKFAIEAYKTITSALDKVTDEQIIKNIRAERVSYGYIIVEYYSTEYKNDTSGTGNITAMKNRTKEDAELNDITMIAQNARNDKYVNGLATDVWKSWGWGSYWKNP